MLLVIPIMSLLYHKKTLALKASVLLLFRSRETVFF
jgi:hypothetical protein